MNTMPTTPGYYWAKWKIAADGTHEGDDLTPSDNWEIVQVNSNMSGWERSDNPERFSVAVPGVRETQWPDCFFWGDRVAEIAKPKMAQPVASLAEYKELRTALTRCRDTAGRLKVNKRIDTSTEALRQHSDNQDEAIELIFQLAKNSLNCNLAVQLDLDKGKAPR